MKKILLAAILLGASLGAQACDCFPPEARDKAAREALDGAKLAVYVRVVEVAASGQARVLVLEAYKGSAKEAILEASQDASRCAMRASFTVGEEALLLAYGDTITACDKYARDNFMVESFRRILLK